MALNDKERPVYRADDMDIRKLGKVLQRRRKALKLRQHDIGKALDCPEILVSRYETGRQTITDTHLAMFALNLKCKISDLEEDIKNV